jgi:hypothetical protein
MIIKFNPVSKLAELTVPPPKPAKNYLPEWYKNIKPFHTNPPEFNDLGRPNRTIKMCMPFADSMTSGYIQESWQDINIEVKISKDGKTEFSYHYPTDPPIMSLRGSNSIISMDNSYQHLDLVWHPQWTPRLPKGYSALYITPLNRHDLPFYTLSGIVDSDSHIQSEKDSNLPFLLKSGFKGVIKKGTPLYQIIPIKRDTWDSKFNEFNEEENIKEVQRLRQYFWGAYKKIHWTKKEYN